MTSARSYKATAQREKLRADSARYRAEAAQHRIARQEAMSILADVKAEGSAYSTFMRSRLDSMPAGNRSESDFFDSTRWLKSMKRRLGRPSAQLLVQTNPIAASIVQCQRDNVIGTGIKARSKATGKIKDPKTGKMRPAADVYTKFFSTWAEDCDVQGRSLYETQDDGFDGCYAAGDFGLLKLEGCKVQLLTSERIATPNKLDPKDKSARVVDGVVTDAVGRPVAFYVQTGDTAFTRYTADQVLFHVERRAHGNDVRGVPAFETTFELFHQLHKLVEAKVIAERVAACFAAVIKKNNAGQISRQMKSRQGSNGQKERISTIQPGSQIYLEPNEDIGQVTPNQSTQHLDDGITPILRLIGMPEGIPLEWFVRDFSKANFGAIIAAALVYKKSIQKRQQRIIRTILTPLYRWVIQWAIETKQLPEADDALEVKWTPPKFGYIQPQVEAMADLVQVDMGSKSIDDVCEEQDRDADHVQDVQSAREKRAASLGLARRYSTSTQAASAKPGNPPPMKGKKAA